MSPYELAARSPGDKGRRGKVLEALTEVPSTLLITVWARALASLEPDPLIEDPFALQIYRERPELFEGLTRMSKIYTEAVVLGVAIRTRCFDRQVELFLRFHPDGLILNIGAGLDARASRLDNGQATWVNVDLAQSVLAAREMLPTHDRLQFIEGSLTAPETWLDAVPRREQKAVLIISEGTLLYFSEAETETLIRALCERFETWSGYVELTGDLAVGKVHPAVAAVGAPCPFRSGYLDPGAALSRMHPAIKVQSQETLFEHERARWGRMVRFMGWVAPRLQRRLGSMLVDFEVGDAD